jgi:hypothetical protein
LAAKAAKAPTTATLTAIGIDGILNTEIVLFTKGAHEDAFLNDYKKYTEGTKQGEPTGIEQCNLLEKANFTALKPRRDPATKNDVMRGPKNFWRKVIVRHTHGGVSTPETRAEGLAVLKQCFLSGEFTNFPPDTIDTIDATDEHHPQALDMFLLDMDIVQIVREHVDQADLNKNFYEKYTDFAKTMWSGTNYPDFARGLGFP